MFWALGEEESEEVREVEDNGEVDDDDNCERESDCDCDCDRESISILETTQRYPRPKQLPKIAVFLACNKNDAVSSLTLESITMV